MKRTLILVAAILVILAAGAGGWYMWKEPAPQKTQVYQTPEEADVFVRFDMEVFDTITTQYVQKAAAPDLAELFRLSLGKAASTTEELPTKDRAGTAKMFAAEFSKAGTDAAKKQLALNTAIIVLANLAPQGRNGLLSSAQEQQFRDTVNNVDRSTDLYQTLGIAKGASSDDISKAYQEKKVSLAQATSTQAQQELQNVEHAYRVLAQTTTKQIYDRTQMQPSIYSRIIGTRTLYIDLSKVTPASFTEFVQDLSNQTSAHPALSGMILDLRGNIGGSLDFVQYFLSLFIGPNQYAFDLFHQGDFLVQRTPNIQKFDAVGRFREIAILTDNMTQSTAELTTAVFKKFHTAHIVGTTTRGWGTVENTFPLSSPIDPSTNFSLLLVKALTLREDNQPIEGKGVDPDVSVTDPKWKSKLSDYFRSPDLINAIIQTESTPSPHA